MITSYEVHWTESRLRTCMHGISCMFADHSITYARCICICIRNHKQTDWRKAEARRKERERDTEREREKKLHQSITLRSAHLPQRIPRQPKTYILHITPDPPTTQDDTVLLENLVRPLPPPTPEFFAPIGQGRRGCAR